MEQKKIGFLIIIINLSIVISHSFIFSNFVKFQLYYRKVKINKKDDVKGCGKGSNQKDE